MPIKEPEHFNFLAAAFGLLMAVFGASAKYIHQLRHGESFYWSVFCGQLVIAAFGGLLITLLASYYHWPAEISGVAAGLAGWSGAEVINFLDKRFWHKAGGGK